MLCSPGPSDHTQEATVGALPGCSQINNYTTEPVLSQTKPLPCLGPDWLPNPGTATSRTWSWSHSARLWSSPVPFNGTWLLLAFSVPINNQGEQHQHRVFNHRNLSSVFRAQFSSYYSDHHVPSINSACGTDFRWSAAQGAQDLICTVQIKCCLCGCNFYEWYDKEIAWQNFCWRRYTNHT